MSRYMLILGGADLDKRSDNPELKSIMLARYMSWIQKLHEGRHYQSSNKLQDRTGARLTVRGGQVVEGPFIETKEAIGGIFVIEAESLEQATLLAQGCPVLSLQNGYVEVRLIEEMGPAK